MIFFHCKSIFKSLSVVTIGWAAFIVISASFMRQLLNLTLTILTRDQVSAFIYTALALIGLLVVWAAWKQKSVQKIVFACLPLGFLACLALAMPMAEERVHIIKYGLLGYLACKDICKAQEGYLKSLFSVLVFGVFVSGLDEAFQALLPYRVGDLRDIGFDCLSLIAGIMIYFIIGGASSRPAAGATFSGT